MKNKVLSLVCLFLLFLMTPARVMAIVDPLARENNKVGVHVLSPDEIETASKLVNGEKGSFGYVVVPIQATDRDRVKWSKFMRKATELKVIPIVRVATYVDEVNWEEPNNFDLIDFANFLNDLPWPTANRYVIIFNEVNRADEYGGYVSPSRYADILVNAVRIFKERNEDFFVLPAGLDNAARTSANAMKWNDYLTAMWRHQPSVFSLIDGWVSHSYPNYGFIGKATDGHDHSIRGYLSELSLIAKFSEKKLPVFITETGWDMEKLSERKVAENFEYAYTKVWNDGRVTMVAPFLLMAGEGPFVKFSLLKKDGSPSLAYRTIQRSVTVGRPVEAELDKVAVKGVNTSSKGNSAQWMGEPKIDTSWFSAWWQSLTRWVTGMKKQDKEKREGREKVRIELKEYWVTRAVDNQSRSRGLSGKKSLAEDEGMLFVFELAGKYGFWMPDMRFDIDIVWIRGGRVVGVSRGDHTKPKEISYPPVDVDLVLEVNPRSEIQVGDEVVLGVE